jgi:hypothetical protein
VASPLFDSAAIEAATKSMESAKHILTGLAKQFSSELISSP